MRRAFSNNTVCLLLLGLVFAGRPGWAAPLVMPFEWVDGFILVRVTGATSRATAAKVSDSAEAAGAPLCLAVDSGASVSVLSLRAARRLELRRGKVVPALGIGVPLAAYQLAPVALRAGALDLGSAALALDLAEATQLCRVPIDGLLGADFFASRIVEIDFAARQLRLLEKADPDAALQRLPIRLQNGVMCVPVGVDGAPPRWTRLDTGCNDALHWVVPAAKKTRDQSPLRKHSTVALAGLRLPRIETALHRQAVFPDEAGLLGTGLLNRFTVTIDAAGRQMLLR